jgi:transcription-repair coupling factor (superfamily II helicase)
MAGITRIALGDVMEPSDLREKLVSLGYTSAAVTESPGEFTSRGGILDVFPPALEHPLRIEFFGDEVDSIRFFDQDTQRSLENTQSAEIGPAAEFLPTDEERKAALRKIRREYDRRITEIKSRYLNKSAVFDSQDGSTTGAGDDQDEGDVENDIAIAREIQDGRIEALEMHKGRVTDLFEYGGNVQIYADFLPYFDIDKFRLWDFAAAAGAEIAVIDPARLEDELPESVSKEEWRSLYKVGESIWKTGAATNSQKPQQQAASEVSEVSQISELAASQSTDTQNNKTTSGSDQQSSETPKTSKKFGIAGKGKHAVPEDVFAEFFKSLGI